jgi:predicted component of type VI protein secretion system
LGKTQAPLPLEDRGAGYQERERRLAYLETLEKLIGRMRRRWGAAAKANAFSYEAWSEAVEAVTDLQTAFVEAVPVEVYATGRQWLPQEEWETVAGTLGSLSMLNSTLDRAFHAYESRFENKGDSYATVKDLNAAREKNRRLNESSELLKMAGGHATA